MMRPQRDSNEFPLGLRWVPIVPDVPGLESKDRVVAAHPRVLPGEPFCPTLPVNDHADFNTFA